MFNVGDKIVYPMHGAGAGYLQKVLATAGREVLEIRGEPNPTFGGVNPEPIRDNLQLLVDTLNKEKAQVGFATDGDADRVGAIDENGNFVNSHLIYALLLRHLIKERKWFGGVVKTFSTSQMIDKIAKQYGVPVFETPIGFKYICELFLQEDILIGGEESGGIGFKNHIPERDGILSSLLLLEIMAVAGKGLGQLIEELMQEIGYHYYDRLDLRFTSGVKERILRLQESPPQALCGRGIKEVQTLDGVKYLLVDDSWILFRSSGTEPMIRIYVEAGSQVQVDKLLVEGQELLKSSC
jgi:phosphomannomutase